MYIFCNDVDVKMDNCLLEQYIYDKHLAHNVLKNSHQITYRINLKNMQPASRELVQNELRALCARCKYLRAQAAAPVMQYAI